VADSKMYRAAIVEADAAHIRSIRGTGVALKGETQVGHHDRNGVAFLDGQSGTFAKLENFDQLFLLKTR